MKILKKVSFYAILFLIVGTTIYLDKTVLFIKDLFPYSSIPYVANINDRLIFITFCALVLYAWETKGMKEEMGKQTETEQMPIMMMYVRNIDDYSKEKKQEQKEYCIETTLGIVANNFDKYGGSNIKDDVDKYLVRIRNVGNGPAFDVHIESKDFKITKYQNRFFAPEPKGDEQSIKIIRKDEQAVQSEYEDLNGAIFEIYCKNVNNKEYVFQYKIINIKEQIVKYLGQKKIC